MTNRTRGRTRVTWGSVSWKAWCVQEGERRRRTACGVTWPMSYLLEEALL